MALQNAISNVVSTVPTTINPRTSVAFGKSQTSSVTNLAYSASGWITSDLDYQSDSRMQVAISSAKMRHVVKGLLPNRITFEVESDWVPFIPLNVGIADKVFQAATGASLTTQFSSRRIWKGTSPVQISMELKFEAIQNARREVIEPCIRLMQMTLPKVGYDVQHGQFEFSIPVLIPPGPSPFAGFSGKGSLTKQLISYFNKDAASSIFQGGDQISLSIGDYLKFDNVIIKTVRPDFDSRIGIDGYPIGASVNIILQTYEMITSNKLDEMFYQSAVKNNPSQMFNAINNLIT